MLTQYLSLSALKAFLTLVSINITILLIIVYSGLVKAQSSLTENPDLDSYKLPPQVIQDIFDKDKNYANLSYMSPDRDHFVIPHSTELSTLDLMSKKVYRLAQLEIRPESNRNWEIDTYGIYDLRFFSLSKKEFVDVDIPEDAFVSDLTWSPAGDKLAFLAHLLNGTYVWVADAATGAVVFKSSQLVVATLGTSAKGQGTKPSSMLQWTPEGSLVTLILPENRGAEPIRKRVPDSPRVRRTRAEPTRTPTFRYLLRDEYDSELFEYYTTSQLAELIPDEKEENGERIRLIDSPQMYESLAISSDGQYLLATTIERPFSFITSYQGFPRKMVSLNLENGTKTTIEKRPLHEEIPFGGISLWDTDNPEAPRKFSWKPEGSIISFLEQPTESTQTIQLPFGILETVDEIRVMRPPFDLNEAEVIVSSPYAIASYTFSADGNYVFAHVSHNGEQAIVYWDLQSTVPSIGVVENFHNSSNPTTLPGDLWTSQSGNGIPYVLMSGDNQYVYLIGGGFKETYKPQPFVDRVSLLSAPKTRIFEGSADYFDQPIAAVDLDINNEKIVISRESKSDFPNSFLWESGGALENLTNNVNPFPEFAAAKRVDFEYFRRDGLKIQARITLPLDYKEGDRVPAVFWTYPSEFPNAQAYQMDAYKSRNHNAFTQMSYLRWSDIWLTQGYALVHPDIPIIGEKVDDTFILDLHDDIYGAIQALNNQGYIDVDRLAHGGHSYGAFTSANLMVHSPYFKAGIAGDGAYNRSLTPAGFQAINQSIWEIPHTYIDMSPFFRAHEMNTPLLMYHGEDDHINGTWTLQSEMFLQALTTLGKEAVLYLYPFEAHTPRAKRNMLDIWARFIDWFDMHVKDFDASSPASL